jgi:hypothetical protein
VTNGTFDQPAAWGMRSPDLFPIPASFFVSNKLHRGLCIRTRRQLDITFGLKPDANRAGTSVSSWHDDAGLTQFRNRRFGGVANNCRRTTWAARQLRQRVRKEITTLRQILGWALFIRQFTNLAQWSFPAITSVPWAAFSLCGATTRPTRPRLAPHVNFRLGSETGLFFAFALRHQSTCGYLTTQSRPLVGRRRSRRPFYRAFAMTPGG